RKLGVRATIYVPSSTPQFMQDILRREGATVCEKVGWNDVPVVAMETEGADCFHKAVEAGHPVTLHDIPAASITDDHRVLVEPSCGATLASVYSGVLDALLREERLQLDKEDAIVLIVCGGAGVSLELLRQWTADVKTKHG
ncbi:PREDICTED: serine dehydratase-like, partial [Priapulus caudatus]|uniref:L-serine ammonia-lyase n=1 Tax=Priapulus caudatus TaxID=37621 RepID=A0ABM1F6Y5_PRICU